VPWYKGNIHCHSTNSDGDLSPREVASLYKRGGYQFLSITDHNHLTDPEEAEPIGEDFLLLRGVEFTYEQVESSYIHVNAIGVRRDLEIPEKPKTLIEGLPQIVNHIDQAGAFSVINHPNWNWGCGARELGKLHSVHAFEVYNAATTCNNEGDSEHLSTDAIWDLLLSRGVQIYGIASDDAHDYTVTNATYAEPPFTGWICVQAERLDQDAIMASLFAGEFYSSNHPILDLVERSSNRFRVRIREIGQIRYTTSFIGMNGKILRQVRGLDATYAPDGTEGYVRAAINDTDGHSAWTQPLFL